MAAKQNLTIQLDRDTIEQAKLLAAVRQTSVSRIVAELIANLVRDDDRFRQAHAQAKRLLKKGFHLGSSKRVRRDALHER